LRQKSARLSVVKIAVYADIFNTFVL
jgi:hypothetical protein